MAKLKETDIRPALGQVSNQAAKNLILAGINGNEDFPTLLQNYQWSTAKPYDMALIIIAYYTYCMKSSDQSIKKFGKEATVKNSRSYKLFNYILEGNGSKIKSHLSDQYFTICMIGILEQILPANDAKILAANIIKGMAQKAKNINLEQMQSNQKSFIQTLINQMRGEAAPISQEKTTSTNQKLSDKDLAKILQIIKWSSNELEITQILNQYNVELNEPYVNPETHEKETLLFYAARENSIFSTNFLLRNHADPCMYSDGHTPLTCALLNTSLYTLKLLIKDRRSINLPCKNAESMNQLANTLPITLALIKNVGNETLKKLIEGGADLNNQNNPNKETPLHTFINYLHTNRLQIPIDVICLLLKNGANPNLKDKHGNTLLHLAVKYYSDNKQLITTLLDNNADPDIENNEHQLPADCTNDPEIVSLLVPPPPSIECPICYEEKSPSDIQYPFKCVPSQGYPNGHYICNACARDYDKCPICNQPKRH